MGDPDNSVTLSAAEIAELNQQLGKMRHNINNQLALLIASLELIRLKPDTAEELFDRLMQQPDRVMKEMAEFSEQLEKTLGIDHVDDEAAAGGENF